MTEKIKKVIVLDLGEKGGLLEFEGPAEVQQWFSEEAGKWQWMRTIPQIRNILQSLNHINVGINQQIQRWMQIPNIDEDDTVQRDSLKRFIESEIGQHPLWLSTSPNGSFILQLSQDLTRGPLIAAGAYIAIGGSYSPAAEPLHPKVFEGEIEGFLYKREIDWTATAHREALEKLKHQYAGNFADQKKKFIEIEQANTTLNQEFSDTLVNKSKLLDELHSSQTEEFNKLVETHKVNLDAIENAYDQKLALLKPVKYWNARKKLHARKAKNFAIASGISMSAILFVLGVLAYEFFLNVPTGEKPQVWQVAVFSVAAFFSIWFERILVRLFISNMHLATDSEERVTMLQTYLSIIREGSEFAPEDKKLILERLFHPVTDGLVKDDAAPATPLELLSRR
jgi:Family of unknown function (DUF6161)